MNIGFLGKKYYDRFVPLKDGEYWIDYTPHPIALDKSNLPHISRLNWYFKNRNPKDKLVLTFQKNNSFRRRYPFILEGLRNFLTKGRELKKEEVLFLHKNNFHQWNEYIGHAVKTFWLVNEYYRFEKFLSPLGGVWDSVRGSWFVHPGLTRLYILDALKKDSIEILGHIPAAVTNSIKYEREFTNTVELTEYFQKDFSQINVALTLDLNTTIPHIHFDSLNTQEYTNTYFDVLVEFFKTHKLEANFDLLPYGYIDNSRSKKIVYLEVESPSLLEETLLIFQAPLKRTIVNKNSKITYNPHPNSFTI